MAGASQGPGILPGFAREATRKTPFGRAWRAEPRRGPLAPWLPPEVEFLAQGSAERNRLLEALEAAPRDVAPLEAVLNEGLVSEDSYYRALAGRLGCALYFGKPPFARHCDPMKSIRSGVAPLASDGKDPRAVIAPRGQLVSRLIEMTASGRLDPASFAVVSPQRLQALIRRSRGEAVLAEALGRLPDVFSARRRMSGAQVVAAAMIAGVAVALGATHRDLLFAGLTAGVWVLFLAQVALRSMAAVAEGVAVRPPALSDEELPVYTVIAALYREAEVVPQLVEALDKLDYPRGKLDIKIVVERSDRETLSRLAALKLPARYEIVAAPPGEPKNKPRALDIALAEARGDLVVVYDAEDEPAPDQLRLAAARFAAESDLDCLQARLVIRNTEDSWLAKLFAVEYTALFDLINPGLCALGLPIALGGSSNHFRRDSLQVAGGWDEWNVTEDADLGVRLARFGYRIASLDSDTFEAAPYEFMNWFRQRTRWEKGWIQTFLVHSREPRHFVRDLGLAHAAAAALIIFGSVASALVWPAYAVEVARRLAAAADAVPSLWREAADVLIYLLALAGVWSILVPALVAARQRGVRLPLGTLILLPVYYLLVTAAAWAAIAELVVRPHHWSKTAHGRTPSRQPTAASSLHELGRKI
jgi:cellulose synthase/poly-beta-1,6-N-acetylglucosamine synthase-like glycosyltransferase